MTDHAPSRRSLADAVVFTLKAAFAAAISALRSAAEKVPQAGVAGAAPDGLLTATACRYMPHLLESPLTTTSFTSAHCADA